MVTDAKPGDWGCRSSVLVLLDRAPSTGNPRLTSFGIRNGSQPVRGSEGAEDYSGLGSRNVPWMLTGDDDPRFELAYLEVKPTTGKIMRKDIGSVIPGLGLKFFSSSTQSRSPL